MCIGNEKKMLKCYFVQTTHVTSFCLSWWTGNSMDMVKLSLLCCLILTQDFTHLNIV